jgi:hypothetical protein
MLDAERLPPAAFVRWFAFWRMLHFANQSHRPSCGPDLLGPHPDPSGSRSAIDTRTIGKLSRPVFCRLELSPTRPVTTRVLPSSLSSLPSPSTSSQTCPTYSYSIRLVVCHRSFARSQAPCIWALTLGDDRSTFSLIRHMYQSFWEARIDAI